MPLGSIRRHAAVVVASATSMVTRDLAALVLDQPGAIVLSSGSTGHGGAAGALRSEARRRLEASFFTTGGEVLSSNG